MFSFGKKFHFWVLFRFIVQNTKTRLNPANQLSPIRGFGPFHWFRAVGVQVPTVCNFQPPIGSLFEGC